MWDAFLLVSQAATLGILGWMVCEYVRARRHLIDTAIRLRRKMDCDELIDLHLEQGDDPADQYIPQLFPRRRSRLERVL